MRHDRGYNGEKARWRALAACEAAAGYDPAPHTNKAQLIDSEGVSDQVRDRRL